MKPKEYLNYLKDNPKGYWFKRKLYGWGWVPVKWQAWVFLISWSLLLAQIMYLISKLPSEMDRILNTSIALILLAIMVFLISYATGEKPKWSWGK